MTPKLKSNLVLLFPMLALALLIYSLHYLIFGSITATMSGVLLSIAYVPIGVVYETLIIQKILDKRERIKIEKKMNIIKGSFYHEIGTRLLFEILKGDRNVINIMPFTNIGNHWTDADFIRLKHLLSNHTCDIDMEKLDLPSIRDFLEANDNFLLNLIVSPLTEEYEDFNNLLMEVLHLRDEVTTLYSCVEVETPLDIDHLYNDICRLYALLLVQWGDYIHHLYKYYPSLFLKAVVKSPFNCLKRLG